MYEKILALNVLCSKAQEFMRTVKEEGLRLTEPRRIVLPHSFISDDGRFLNFLSLCFQNLWILSLHVLSTRCTKPILQMKSCDSRYIDLTNCSCAI